ncbi:MAG TPA: hypothetical protein VEK38_03170 [Candidatus Bathyarchaeia archaeon]|nr:hypothetical protein [Candidatus Bathyarchaeia archaeon]
MSNLTTTDSFIPSTSIERGSFSHFTCTITEKNATLYTISITIPACIIDIFFTTAASTQQQHIQASGLSKDSLPISYVIQNYTMHLTEYLKEFLLKYCIINVMYHVLRMQKLSAAGDPRLENIELTIGHNALYHFNINKADPIHFQEWKYFPFKTPQRKNYKDIDRQAENFITQEVELLAKTTTHDIICINDWICFDITITDQAGTHLIADNTHNFWFRITDEELENPLRDLFLGKKKHESFLSSNRGFQEYFSAILEGHYTFSVTIVDIVPHAYVCFEQFKYHFKIKTNKDLHKKIIEVFSYRHDISQRRAIVEETLKVLTSRHGFFVPDAMILRRKKKIMEIIRENPDFNVYKKQKDFEQSIDHLAHRQAREIFFIEQFAYNEGIAITHQDLAAYFNLMKRKRIKEEFLYFDIPSSKHSGQEVPIPTEEMYLACMREKALNHAIYHLTKK